MLKGIPVSEGTGIGKAYVIKDSELKYEKRAVEDKESEKERFHDAVEEYCRRTDSAADCLSDSAPKEAEIIRGHKIMIQDPFMISQMDSKIENGSCAEEAAEEILDMFKEMFLAAEDELTQQRAADVEDIKAGLLRVLLGVEEQNPADIPPGSVIITADLKPSMTANLDRNKICGIVTENGGKTSHSAILARALELPAILSVPDAVAAIETGMTVIVDGNEGIVIPNPDKEMQRQYERKQAAFVNEKNFLQRTPDDRLLPETDRRRKYTAI